MPVIGEAVFELEPLAGEAQVQSGGIGPDIARRAERRIDHVPDPVLVLIGHPRGAAEMVGVDKVERRVGAVDPGDDRDREIADSDEAGRLFQ